MLNLPEELENKTNAAKSFPIKFQLPMRNLSDDIYYVACDEVQPNFVSNDLKGVGVLGVVPVPETFNNQVVKHYNDKQYCRFHDSSRPRTLYIRLLDKDGNRIFINEPQFYVLLHIRRYV